MNFLVKLKDMYSSQTNEEGKSGPINRSWEFKRLNYALSLPSTLMKNEYDINVHIYSQINMKLAFILPLNLVCH